jgi:tetrahydromethanopterin S-methyltransferase subunit B
MFQELKLEIETIKKIYMEASLEMDNIGKRSEATDTSITNRIQEIEERISGLEDTIENVNTSIKENTKCKKVITQNIQ